MTLDEQIEQIRFDIDLINGKLHTLLAVLAGINPDPKVRAWGAYLLQDLKAPKETEKPSEQSQTLLNYRPSVSRIVSNPFSSLNQLKGEPQFAEPKFQKNQEGKP